jgi:RNA polymerase sigma-70 factor (ECF subfamily)
VVVERRDGERRSGGERRDGDDKARAKGERRRVRSAAGRRVAERRATVGDVEPPQLPRRARRHAAELRFVRRMEPSGQKLEDRDTARVVARYQAGDREAYAILYKRYFSRVFGYLRVVLNNPHDAEDAAQEVFANVLAALPKYKAGSRPFRAWLFRIVRNQALDELRAGGREDLLAPEDLDEARERTGEVEEPDLPVLDWITDRDLSIFVERLTLQQRQVLLLRYLMGMRSEEIAETLGITAPQVRGLQRRAVDFLRERMVAIGREPKGVRRPEMQRFRKQAQVLRNRRFALDP